MAPLLLRSLLDKGCTVQPRKMSQELLAKLIVHKQLDICCGYREWYSCKGMIIDRIPHSVQVTLTIHQ